MHFDSSIANKTDNLPFIKAHLPIKQKPFKIPGFIDNNKKPDIVQNHGKYLGTTHSNSILTDPLPLHDPEAHGAIVLYRPKKLTSAEKLAELTSRKINENNKIVNEIPVVLDPKLSKVLRPHQIDGVRFMFECVSGLRDSRWRGCIMADEMGLGKTLQCISLIWTIIKQSPVSGVPYVDKCVICCPSSLVKNWQNEFIKWLGSSAPQILSIDNSLDKTSTRGKLIKFFHAKRPTISEPILIISYDSLRIYQECFQNIQCGLLVCDEAHRLKSTLSLTYRAITSMKTEARVIITGTPVQNDLADFALQGALGTYKEFRNKFELHIERGRDAMATYNERVMGEKMLSELTLFVNTFIIRRTSDFLTNYLPPKYDYVVFCSLSECQVQLYTQFLSSESIKSVLSDSSVQPLKCITYLKKLCNHPFLVENHEDGSMGNITHAPNRYSFDMKQRNHKGNINRVNQNSRDYIDFTESGKLFAVYNILKYAKEKTHDKIVLISNYSMTLSLFEKLLSQEKWTFVRLDGSLTVKKRQDVVERFNKDANVFAFLLSSKAGGCGINLIGANRLILYDSDWNPANDMQALARVWRDGQSKICYIYRFISTGTIEEKILQSDYLKRIFSYNQSSPCETHDLFKCKYCMYGINVQKSAEKTGSRPASTDMSTWDHFNGKAFHKIADIPLKVACSLSKCVTFVFQNKVRCLAYSV